MASVRGSKNYGQMVPGEEFGTNEDLGVIDTKLVTFAASPLRLVTEQSQ